MNFVSGGSFAFPQAVSFSSVLVTGGATSSTAAYSALPSSPTLPSSPKIAATPGVRFVATPQVGTVIQPAAPQSQKSFGDGHIEAPEVIKRPNRPLPEGSEAWTSFETDLFQLSRGAYNPSKMAQRRRIEQQPTKGVYGGTGVANEIQGRVSVVTPTMCSRQQYHEQLWACFEAQTWQDKELIVVESYEEQPSAFLRQKAREDPRLIHVCFKRSFEKDFNVGLKRDMTLHLASGEYVANFDDDDIYAATYLTTMVNEIRSKGLVGITLSTWYNYLVSEEKIGYTDPQVAWEINPKLMKRQEMEEVLYGYGFSYVHTRRAGLAFPYPDVEFAEDAPFFLTLKQVFGQNRVALKKDEDGLCMHLVHRANSAGDMPIARSIELKDVGNLDVAPLFQLYLERKQSLIVPHLRSVINGFDLAVQSFTDLWRQIPQTEGSACVLRHRRVKSC